jgi:hypothetical protein
MARMWASSDNRQEENGVYEGESVQIQVNANGRFAPWTKESGGY